MAAGLSAGLRGMVASFVVVDWEASGYGISAILVNQDGRRPKTSRAGLS